MNLLLKAFIVMTAIVTASPVFAQASGPATKAFDGTYGGISRQLEGGAMSAGQITRACPPSGGAAVLAVANGMARTAWGRDNFLEGSPTPQGALVMRAPNGARFDGQIDVQGRITGRITSFCSYQMVWQKQR